MSEPVIEQQTSEMTAAEESAKTNFSDVSSNLAEAQPSICDASPAGSGSSKRLLKKNKSGAEIFVGDVSFFCSDFDLLQLFSEHGHVLRTRIKRSDKDGRTLMYGFVYMEHVAEAEKAVQKLNGMLFQGRNIRVELSGNPRPPSSGPDDSHQIFVSFSSDETNVNPITLPTESLLREVIEAHVPVKDIAIKEYHCDEITHRQNGFCFAAFHTIEDAKTAFSALHEKKEKGFVFLCSLSFHCPLADCEFNQKVQQRVNQRRRSVPFVHNTPPSHMTPHVHIHQAHPPTGVPAPFFPHTPHTQIVYSHMTQTQQALSRHRAQSDEAVLVAHSRERTTPSHTQPHHSQSQKEAFSRGQPAHSAVAVNNIGYFPMFPHPVMSPAHMISPPLSPSHNPAHAHSHAHLVFPHNLPPPAAPYPPPHSSPTQQSQVQAQTHNAFSQSPTVPTQAHFFTQPPQPMVYFPANAQLAHTTSSDNQSHPGMAMFPVTQNVAYFPASSPAMSNFHVPVHTAHSQPSHTHRVMYGYANQPFAKPSNRGNS